MSKLTDRISYLKGLADGMKLDKENNVVKLQLEMLNVMADMAEEMATMAEQHNDLSEYVESIDDDLADLEETLFGDDDFDDDDLGDDEDDDDDEDEADLDDDLIVYACPHCGHDNEFHASDVDFDTDYLCSACHKPIFPELHEDK